MNLQLIALLVLGAILGTVAGAFVVVLVLRYKAKKITQNALKSLIDQKEKGFVYSRKEGKKEIFFDPLEQIDRELKGLPPIKIPKPEIIYEAKEDENEEMEQEEELEFEEPEKKPKRAKNPKMKRPTNKWILHLKKYAAEHPELSYSEAMHEAKKTYEKD